MNRHLTRKAIWRAAGRAKCAQKQIGGFSAKYEVRWIQKIKKREGSNVK